MKRTKYYILGAYLLILLDTVSSYYLIEAVRKDTEVLQHTQTQVISGLSHVYNKVMIILDSY